MSVVTSEKLHDLDDLRPARARIDLDQLAANYHALTRMQPDDETSQNAIRLGGDLFDGLGLLKNACG